jgi:hypothetical protein
VTVRVSRQQVMRYRARVTHLHEKLPAGSYAEAAWGGLQDSVPRAGVISLHARVEGTLPDSWAHPSLAQIWFRGGADYIVARRDAGIFTLGSFPRDPEQGLKIQRLADDIHRVTQGRTLRVREVQSQLSLEHPTSLRISGLSGRIHIRWDASNIWLIPVEAPDIDVEDARRELARRFLHWFGPTTKQRMAMWTGVQPGDATTTWKAIEKELVAIDLESEGRFLLASDVEALVRSGPVRGVRLLPYDDALTKLDRELLVDDASLRARVFPPTGRSPGYLPGAVLVDGQIVGAWQRRQTKVTIHPWSSLTAGVRAQIECEAMAFPIASMATGSVKWD